MALPPDACSLIVKYAADSRSTLVSLCTVSKQFQNAAERALYNTLQLKGPDRTTAVCDMLARTPRVTMLVVALSVFGAEQDSDDSEENLEAEPSAEYWQVLHASLRNMKRLRYLNLHFNSGGQTDKAWILAGCPFQLRAFHCDLAWDAQLVSFLVTQSRLADLFLADFREPELKPEPAPGTMDVGKPVEVDVVNAAFLPKLCVLECTFSEAAIALVPERPVSRVKTCFTHSKLEEKREELRAIVGALKRSKKRFRALDIADSSYSADFSLELLSTLTSNAFFCGDMRYIGTLVMPVDGRQRLEFYGFLMRLPQLRCIEVDVSDWEPAPTHPAALRALTCELRLYCPLVSTAVFVYEFERHLVRMVDHIVVYDEDATTDNLWREV